jgi:hypothetical protein
VFLRKDGQHCAALWLGVIVKRRAIDPEGAPTWPWSQPLDGAASLALWTIAIVAGRLMAYLKSDA